jgi:hypothetical protein
MHLQRAGRAGVGTALGVLLAADAPALTELDVRRCNLGDAGLGPLLEALPANTHLRTLKCTGNNTTGAFAADVLLPAVCANTSLRALDAGWQFFGDLEAEGIVYARR